MEFYQKKYIINFGHIDNRGIARPSALFDYMQDAATLHAQSLQLSRDDIHAIWVLSRMKMQLKRPLYPGDEVTLTTWCTGIQGATWHRSFSFQCGNENLGEGHSVWVLLDWVNRRIMRPPALPQVQRYLRSSGENVPILGKLACAHLTPLFTHRVCYSDLDINNHVNNVKIVDLVSDGLDLNLTQEFVSDLQVNFTAESRFGDHIELLAGLTENTHFIFGRADGHARFESALILSPIP